MGAGEIGKDEQEGTTYNMYVILYKYCIGLS